MRRFGIEDEGWFEAARTGLERRGFTLRFQPRSIIIDKEARLPRIVGSAREFVEFAERQGLPIEPDTYDAADRYGDGRSDLSARQSPSPFETPSDEAGRTAQLSGGDVGTLLDDVRRPSLDSDMRRPGDPDMRRPGGDPDMRRPGGDPDMRHPGVEAIEARLDELRHEQDRLAAERRASRVMSYEKQLLEMRCSTLEAELSRQTALMDEAVKQRDLWQMSASAAEDRLRVLQAEAEGPPMPRGSDKKFDQLRRFLARELHPDLAGEDGPERRVREALFKRIWAKVEQLQ